jgi:hypothetical protein
MTPCEIEVALRFYYDPRANESFQNPGHRHAIDHLLNNGLLEKDGKGNITPVQARMQVYVDALRNVPLPVLGWVMP